MQIKKFTIDSPNGTGYLVNIPQANGFLMENMRSGEQDFYTFEELSGQAGVELNTLDDAVKFITNTLDSEGITGYTVKCEVIGTYEPS